MKSRLCQMMRPLRIPMRRPVRYLDALFDAAVELAAGLSFSPEAPVPALLVPAIKGDAKSPRANIPTANARITSSLKFNCGQFSGLRPQIGAKILRQSLVQKILVKDSCQRALATR